jgi:hypothetical protein
MKRLMDRVVDFVRREWFLFVVMGVVALLVYLFEVMGG